MSRRLGQSSQSMCQTNMGELIALRKRGMRVDGLSKFDTTDFPRPTIGTDKLSINPEPCAAIADCASRADSHIKDSFLASNCVT